MSTGSGSFTFASSDLESSGTAEHRRGVAGEPLDRSAVCDRLAQLRLLHHGAESRREPSHRQAGKMVLETPYRKLTYTISTIIRFSFTPLRLFLSHRYEKFFGHFADHNLCVTDAMRRDLWKNWNIRYTFNIHLCIFENATPTSLVN